jgi:hypothetical protein
MTTTANDGNPHGRPVPETKLRLKVNERKSAVRDRRGVI